MMRGAFVSLLGDVIKEAVMKFLIGTMMLVWVLTMFGLWFINA